MKDPVVALDTMGGDISLSDTLPADIWQHYEGLPGEIKILEASDSRHVIQYGYHRHTWTYRLGAKLTKNPLMDGTDGWVLETRDYHVVVSGFSPKMILVRGARSEWDARYVAWSEVREGFAEGTSDDYIDKILQAETEVAEVKPLVVGYDDNQEIYYSTI